MGLLQGRRLVNTVHELRVLPLRLGGEAMRRNDVNARKRVLRLAQKSDSVARYAEKHEPESLQRIQRVWNRDKMQRTTIADKRGWAPAADDTAEAFLALGLKGHTVGEEDVPGDLDRDVTRAVVTNRVTTTRTRPNSLRTRACLRDYEAAYINTKRS
jgi:hypothetical protein